MFMPVALLRLCYVDTRDTLDVAPCFSRRYFRHVTTRHATAPSAAERRAMIGASARRRAIAARKDARQREAGGMICARGRHAARRHTLLRAMVRDTQRRARYASVCAWRVLNNTILSPRAETRAADVVITDADCRCYAAPLRRAIAVVTLHITTPCSC